MNKFNSSIILVILLCLPFVMADKYTPTAATDFAVYIDPNPYMDGKMYATIDMGANPDVVYRCITMAFINQSGFTHVQSNPILAESSGISLRVGAVTPEENGFFTITNGLGTVYWRKFNQVAGMEFLYVVKCNNDNATLTWEGYEVPEYREIGKTLPGRAIWVTNTPNIGFIIFIWLLALVLLFGAIKLFRR